MKTNNLPKMTDLRKMYPYISKEELKGLLSNSSYKTVKGLLNYLDKQNEDYSRRANMPNVKTMIIEIVWSNNSTWGANPTASVYWEEDNGKAHFLKDYARASGCGYDKESTVVARCCNAVLSGMLWRKKRQRRKAPYGVIYGNCFPYFEGGVGMSCYYSIAAFLGGVLIHVANDKYQFTFKTKKS